MFGNWLSKTRELQENYYNVDYPNLVGDELDKYVLWNVTAATDELHEALGEIPSWKPWTTSHGLMNRDAFIGELVDALHFIANLACAAGASDEELSTRYEAKMEKNRQRVLSQAYDGVTGKCPVCRRAYDDTYVLCSPEGGCAA